MTTETSREVPGVGQKTASETKKEIRQKQKEGDRKVEKKIGKVGEGDTKTSEKNIEKKTSISFLRQTHNTPHNAVQANTLLQVSTTHNQ